MIKGTSDIDEMLKDLETQFEKTKRKIVANQYAATSNKVPLLIWGMWWFVLSIYTTATILEHTYSLRDGLIISVAILNLICDYRVIKQNHDIRTNLFLQEI